MKAYLKRSKNDANDAAAICEAVRRPSIRTPPANAVVKIKLIEFATWALRCSTGGAAMQDVQAYLEKPRTDAVDCALISKQASDRSAEESAVRPTRRSLSGACIGA
jgi:hypothetical protein